MRLSDYVAEETPCFDALKSEKRPVFIYGMGDGALKIMAEMRRKGIPVAGFFASDEFVRGHSFEGYRVHSLSEIERQVDDFVIVLAFAAGYPELYNKISALDEKHTLYAPDVPVTGDGLFDRAYYLEHYAELEAVCDMLADEKSRRVLGDIISYKISGKIRYLTQAQSDKDEIYRSLLRVTENESYVDLGAYNGDTVRELLSYTGGGFDRIYAAEPDFRNFRKLSAYIDSLGSDRAMAYPCAAWSRKTELCFEAGAGRQSAVSDKGRTVEAVSVDYMLDGSAATLIKMDVEGAEREAVLGCSDTIRRYSPRMIVSVYHRNRDLFDLPLLLRKMNPDCRMYLRHMQYIPAWDTLLILTNQDNTAAYRNY